MENIASMILRSLFFMLLCTHSLLAESVPLKEKMILADTRLEAAYGFSDPKSEIASLAILPDITISSWRKYRCLDDFPEDCFDPRSFTQRGAGFAIRGNKSRGWEPRPSPWDAYLRTRKYIERLIEDAKRKKGYRWSEAYLSEPHVRSWLQSDTAKDWYRERYGEPYTAWLLRTAERFRKGASEAPPRSPDFDLDVLLSLHAAQLSGQKQNDALSCGAPGQVRRCDNYLPSPFYFLPWQTGRNCPRNSSSPWSVSLIHDRLYDRSPDSTLSTGQHWLPIPFGEKDRCETNHLFPALDPAQSLLHAVKQYAVPPAAKPLLDMAPKELSELSREKELAFMLLSGPVEESYFALEGSTLDPSLIQKTEQCRGCITPKDSSGLPDFSLTARRSQCELRCVPSLFQVLYKTNQSGKFTDRRGRRSNQLRSTSHRSLFRHSPDAARKSLLPQIDALLETEGLSREEIIREAAPLVRRLMLLHPFNDGNGRTSRSLLNLIVSRHGLLTPFFMSYYGPLASSSDRFREAIEEGIETHLTWQEKCSSFVSCLRNNHDESKLSSEELCSTSSRIQTCWNGTSPTYVRGMAPCDCSTHWAGRESL